MCSHKKTMAEANKNTNKNTGYLFPNEKKNDRQPDFRGKATIEGKEFLISAWKRDKDGTSILSLSITDPSTLPPVGQTQNQPASQPKNDSGKSDPHPEVNKNQDQGAFPDPDFFSDIFDQPK